MSDCQSRSPLTVGPGVSSERGAVLLREERFAKTRWSEGLLCFCFAEFSCGNLPEAIVFISKRCSNYSFPVLCALQLGPSVQSFCA